MSRNYPASEREAAVRCVSCPHCGVKAGEPVAQEAAAQPVSVGAGAMTHGRNCPALTPGNDDECRCGLKWRERIPELEAELAAGGQKFQLIAAELDGARAELKAAREEAATLRKRIHNVEKHNQWFERCESAWCNPSSDNNPAREPIGDRHACEVECTLATYKDALRRQAKNIAIKRAHKNHKSLQPEAIEKRADEIMQRWLTESQPREEKAFFVDAEAKLREVGTLREVGDRGEPAGQPVRVAADPCQYCNRYVMHAEAQPTHIAGRDRFSRLITSYEWNALYRASKLAPAQDESRGDATQPLLKEWELYT